MKPLRQLLAIIILLVTPLVTAPVYSVHADTHPETDTAVSDLLLQFSSGSHLLGFRADGFYLTDATYALHVQFVGANPVPPQSDAPTAPAEGGALPLQRVTYANLWDGIMLTYEPVSGGLVRSAYRLEPGADVDAIRLCYNVPVMLNTDGSLTLSFATGQMTESAPIAWQEIDGQRVPVSIDFQVFGSEVGFRVGAYDPARPLFIDPTITWNTFLGGGGEDWTNGGIALDGSGNLYVTGYSTATWQGTAVPRRAFSGAYDAFAAKLDASGGLVWNTFLGGIGIDIGEGIAVDGSGNVYVTGYSDASWQGTTAPRRTYSGNNETFAAKLDANGNLVWNTFLGPGSDDYGSAIAVDGSGNVYVTGESSATWQETTAPQRTYSGGYDAVALKLNTSGDLLWHTFLGGGGDDFGRGIVVAGSNVYVTGYSYATWQGGTAPRRDFSSGVDAFAAKLDAGGNLTWNTFLGGTGTDNGEGIAVDGSGNVYVTGHSRATWTGATAPRHTFSGNVDAFAAKLDASGDLAWNTFLGGNINDFGRGIVVDGSGNVYVTGASNTTWQGATPPQPAYSGDYDAFAAQLNPSGDLLWNAFLGGSGEDQGFGIAVDGSSNVYVTGYSNTTWQGTTAPQRSYSGGFDVFAAKLTPSSNNADLSSLVLSSGTLNPAFASATTSYTAGVAYSVASLTVTPTAADAGATITVNGTPVASGSASGAIPLNVGSNTITTIVTAADGVTTRTYTVFVTRACAGAITVTSNADSGAGSLRQAITDICPGGTITFDNDHTITLASQLTANKSLTIDGAGHIVAVSGNNAVRVFYISGGTVIINNLTIQNGRNVPAIPTNIGGAGLFVDTGAAVTLNNCAVLNNATNASPAVGGGIVVNTGASLTMNNCTLSGNSSSFDGGGILNLGTLNVNNATIVNNTTPGAGGGLETASGTTTLRNTIIAGNSGSSGPDCYTPGGTTQSAGYNMVGSTLNCVITPNASDVTGFSYTSLLLGSLQNNGGPNSTYALLPGSPAIDAIPGCNGAPATDQRGISRPQGIACDIGAFESRGFTLGSLIGTPQSAAINTAFATPLGLTVTSASGEPVAGGRVTFTPPGGGASAVITGSPATIAASGTVSVTATANGTVGGPYNVTTSATGAASVNFALINTGLTTVTVGSSANPSTYGNPVTFTATVAPVPTGGTVAFRDNGVDLAGCSAQPINGSGQATCTTSALAGGTHANITAAYSGNANYASSVSGSYSQTVDPAATTTTLGSDTPDPSVVGQSITFTYTVGAPGGGTPTGNVTVGNGTVSCVGTVAAGSCSVAVTAASTTNFTAVYAGDGNFAGSSSTTDSHTTNKAATTTTITSDAPDPSAVGQSVTIAFTVAPVAPGAGTPTGNVTVSDGTLSCTGTVAAGSCTIAFTSVGPKTLTATYAGDTNFNTSTSASQAHTVNSAGTATTITADVPDPSVVGVALPVSYSVTVTGVGAGTPTGNVTVSDGVDSCTATVADGGCSITLTTTGTRTLTATYAGDTNFGGSSDTETHVVEGPPNVTLINSSADTGDGRVLENEHTNAAITQLLVIFSKDMNADTPGDWDDVLNPANYSLMQDGSVVIPINTVTYNAGARTATLVVNGGAVLPNGKYTFTVLGRIEDTLGAPIGADFVRAFYVDNGAPTLTSVVTIQGGAAIIDGATINVGFSSIDVRFNEDVYDPALDTDPDDVTNRENYLLVTPGPNGVFNTSACSSGLDGDDLALPIGPVIYNNNGGAGPFVATVQLNGGAALPNGTYRLFVCGTTSIVDLAGNALNNRVDDQRTFTVLITAAGAGSGSSARRAPRTGFAPGMVTVLPPQSAEAAYADLGNLWLEVPKLGVKMPIVGVPLSGEEWNVSWLSSNAGWLEGSAYPSWNGNSVLTGHVWNADNSAGPFRYLNTLWWGDKVIVHLGAQQYVYEVRSVKEVKPTDVNAMLKHEELPWLTLVTCKGYDGDSGEYRSRVLVRAVLVEVK